MADSRDTAARPGLLKPALSSEDVLRSQWPAGVVPGRIHELLCDDEGRKRGTCVRLVISPEDSDVSLAFKESRVGPGARPALWPGLRVRTHAGGGQGRRTRQALLWLAEAIRLDAADGCPTTRVLELDDQ